MEREIEEYLRQRVKEIGGKAYKFVSPGNDGVPDRLVCFPDGSAAFVELKAPGGRTRPLQKAKQRELERLGQTVQIIDSRDGVDRFIREYGPAKEAAQ